jgi:hypothetical protein
MVNIGRGGGASGRYHLPTMHTMPGPRSEDQNITASVDIDPRYRSERAIVPRYATSGAERDNAYKRAEPGHIIDAITGGRIMTDREVEHLLRGLMLQCGMAEAIKWVYRNLEGERFSQWREWLEERSQEYM